MLQIGRSLARSRLVSLEFFIEIKSFRSYYGPGVDSASNINEYQEYFLGVKSGRYVRLTTLPPSCAVVTKFGNLNFLEPSGTFQSCNGADLPLPFFCIERSRFKWMLFVGASVFFFGKFRNCSLYTDFDYIRGILLLVIVFHFVTRVLAAENVKKMATW